MKTERLIVLLLVLMVGFQGISLYKQTTAPDPSQALRQMQEQQRPPVRDAPKGSAMELVDLPVQGDKDAKVALIEFSDYQCPYCIRHATGVGGQLFQKYIATGKVKHVFVNNPLPIHAEAKALATAALCAGQQGRYWEMHDGIFKTSPKSKADIISVAKATGMNAGTFEKCIEDDATLAARIARDTSQARQFNLSGTPSFALGRVDSRGHVSIDKFIIGAQPIELFDREINAQISKS